MSDDKPMSMPERTLQHRRNHPNDKGLRTTKKVLDNGDILIRRSGLGSALWTNETRKKPKAAPLPLSTQPLTDLTVAQLKRECKDRGLKISGRKAELITRINEWEYHCGIGGEEE